MKVELTKEECSNVRQSLILTSKRSEVDSNDMKILLILSDKFNWIENPSKTANPDQIGAKEEKKEKKE